MADFPVVPKRINDPAQSPAMRVINRMDFACPRPNCLRAYRRGILHDEQHSHRASPKRFGTEIEMLRRFFRNPELCAGYGQLSYAAAWDTVQLPRAKRSLVELHRSRPVPDRQRRRDAGPEVIG